MFQMTIDNLSGRAKMLRGDLFPADPELTEARMRTQRLTAQLSARASTDLEARQEMVWD